VPFLGVLNWFMKGVGVINTDSNARQITAPMQHVEAMALPGKKSAKPG
jgi:hypothetical protein